MKFVNQLLSQHIARYPRMQLDDIYKLLHQAALGPGHAVKDTAAAAHGWQRRLQNSAPGRSKRKRTSFLPTAGWRACTCAPGWPREEVSMT